MKQASHQSYEVIIIGGSYAGLAAAMALGRSLRHILVIDSDLPCNRQTPHSHNFLTQDGVPPLVIKQKAQAQVAQYDTVHFLDGLVKDAQKVNAHFELTLATGERLAAQQIIFATGVRDLPLPIAGFEQCWGISILHCPYCHGYEVRNQPTAVIADGEEGLEFALFLKNWTSQLTMLTNGASELTSSQKQMLQQHGIPIIEHSIATIAHDNGYVRAVNFQGNESLSVKAIYAHIPFEQHSDLPERLGCELTEMGHVKVNPMQQTTVEGVYAAGDCTTPMRMVAAAVAQGTIAGAMLNKQFIFKAINV